MKGRRKRAKKTKGLVVWIPFREKIGKNRRWETFVSHSERVAWLAGGRRIQRLHSRARLIASPISIVVSTIAKIQNLSDNRCMALHWDLVATRLSTRGPDGTFLSALTGDETDDELRLLVVRFAQACPACKEHSGCPFGALRNLYHASLQAILDGMTRSAMLGLFELEQEARNNSAASSCLQTGGKFAVGPEPNKKS